MIGKILGVASVALTQFFIWVILTLAIVFGFQLAMGPELMGDPEAMEQMTQMAGMGTEQITEMAQASESEMAQVFSAIKEVQQLVLPVTIPLIIGLLLMLQAFQNPDSQLAFWGSMIPFTSPMVMLARVPFEGCVQTWELLLSIGLLLITFLIAV